MKVAQDAILRIRRGWAEAQDNILRHIFRGGRMVSPVKEIKSRVEVSYRWSYGHHLSRFFAEAKQNRRLMGVRCPQCQGVFVPPRLVCGRCFKETSEWVEVGDEGVLETFTTVYLPFPGQPTEPPYTYGYIRLDGTATHIAHLIKEIDPADIKVGMRVKAVWSRNPQGDLFDILHFKPV
jgi:uncharacterized OB-fold protein